MNSNSRDSMLRIGDFSVVRDGCLKCANRRIDLESPSEFSAGSFNVEDANNSFIKATNELTLARAVPVDAVGGDEVV